MGIFVVLLEEVAAGNVGHVNGKDNKSTTFVVDRTDGGAGGNCFLEGVHGGLLD